MQSLSLSSSTWIPHREALSIIGCSPSRLRTLWLRGLIRARPISGRGSQPKKLYCLEDARALAAAGDAARSARIARLLDRLASAIGPRSDLGALWAAAGEPSKLRRATGAHRARAVRAMLLEVQEARARGDRPEPPDAAYRRLERLSEGELARRIARSERRR
jgi:hypothetical protein